MHAAFFVVVVVVFFFNQNFSYRIMREWYETSTGFGGKKWGHLCPAS